MVNDTGFQLIASDMTAAVIQLTKSNLSSTFECIFQCSGMMPEDLLHENGEGFLHLCLLIFA